MNESPSRPGRQPWRVVFLGTAVTGLVLLIIFLLIQSNGGFSDSRLLIRLSMVSGTLFILGSIGWGLSVLPG